MGIVKSTAKTAIAAKIVELVRREAAKPENQAKARELLHKLTQRAGTQRSGGRQRSFLAGGRKTKRRATARRPSRGGILSGRR